MLLQDYLTESAQRYPGKAAVIHQDRRLTYAQLERYADILSAQLAEAGVKRGDRVAIFIENSCEYVAAYFAVLKTGAIVVALNAQMVPREVRVLLEDCTPSALLTDKKHARLIDEVFGGMEQRLTAITVDIPALEAGSGALTVCGRVPCTEEDIAAIIYTSGTTGRPKGVMLSHANLTANAESIVEYLRLTADDRVMVILPFYYSYGASLLTTHIRAGGTLVIDNRFLYPNVVVETMQKEEVTGFAGVPSHFAILLRKSMLRTCSLPRLRYVTQAGGAMSPDLIREFTEALPGAAFYVMYGQTEASARLSYLEPAFLHTKTGSIGRAIPGVELEVRDENGQKVRSGEIGEIAARGKNIMRGYWRSPEETRTVLRDGWLLTGDLARCDEDGFLYIVSRKRDMIKSGANRISPREIEDVVCTMDGIVECAAVGIPDEILGEAIALFVVAAGDGAVSEKDVAVFCRRNLAAFKAPKSVHVVSSLPKTASGKTKREELKAAHASRQQAPGDYRSFP